MASVVLILELVLGAGIDTTYLYPGPTGRREYASPSPVRISGSGSDLRSPRTIVAGDAEKENYKFLAKTRMVNCANVGALPQYSRNDFEFGSGFRSAI